MIRRLLALWHMRDTPYADMVELHELVIMAGRRCAYDLLHASQDIPLTGDEKFDDAFGRNFFWMRGNQWEKVFNPADGGKNYRHRPHHHIFELENEITRLKELCLKNNINSYDPNGIPF